MFELIINSEWDALTLRMVLWSGVVCVTWLGMAVACFADMWSGVNTARAIGEKVHSHRLRETFQKIKDYAGVLLPFLFIDIIGSMFTFYYLPFFQIVIAMGSILIEGWSVLENKRRKKSHAALLPELVTNIVKCAREKDAEAIIDAIQRLSTKDNNQKIFTEYGSDKGTGSKDNADSRRQG
ncbi:MAG: hypothetical protein K2H16_06130 [Prevotella sp.]|nr:hypothetical protein [Prevotella sp.]MDE6152225.1 hypothetical protein [Prevotella sp.]